MYQELSANCYGNKLVYIDGFSLFIDSRYNVDR